MKVYPKPSCKGNHSTGETLVEVWADRNTHSMTSYDGVVRWCSECGAIVIDKEFDGRLVGQYVQMKFPKICTQAIEV